ncbi:MAG: hypothetical protein KKH40_03160, partial [Nanoarchaeota archaeon]|nr:hypothetical protein [Nanoarchaeota archaeon]
DVFKKVGFYPGKYFLFHNELAVSLRLQNLDYKITYFPEIKCFHKSPPNKRMNGFRMHYLMRNGSWNAWSFMPLKYLVFWYPGFVINNIFLSFKYKAFKGFFKGLFQSYTRLIFYFFKNRSPCYSKEWIEYIKKSFRL